LLVHSLCGIIFTDLLDFNIVFLYLRTILKYALKARAYITCGIE
jgi:hypothetical protein